jgi:large subunit ribosomal protein L29
MKQSVIAQMTTDEIKENIQIQSENYGKLRSTHTISQLENPKQLSAQRKTIARLKTELNKRNQQES